MRKYGARRKLSCASWPIVVCEAMATSWLFPMHAKGKSKVTTIKDCTDYSMNPKKTVNKTAQEAIADAIGGGTDHSQNQVKTKGVELVKGYECDPRTVTEEFMLAKKEYEYLTGRDQGKRDILFYRIRQSFKPGEIEPEKALEVGYELGLRWTKGRHAFLVSVHTDRAHIHCHIDYNSTTLDCRGKFDNFKGSSLTYRRKYARAKGQATSIGRTYSTSKKPRKH